MPGTYLTPRSYNRRWWIDVSVNGTPEWAEIAKGISSRGTNISEQSQDYYDMAGRGVAESEVTGITVSRTWSGWRVLGDKAQDAIMEKLYSLDGRRVKFLECYDNMADEAVNGHQGFAVLSVTDDGSGDANNRENIGFGLKIEGTPEAGTVTIGAGGVPTFVSKAAKVATK